MKVWLKKPRHRARTSNNWHGIEYLLMEAHTRGGLTWAWTFWRLSMVLG